MLHWRLVHITILSLGSLTSIAWAAKPPLCPSQTTQPDQSAPAPAPSSDVPSQTSEEQTPTAPEIPANAKATPPNTKSRRSGLSVKERKPGADDGTIDIHGDTAKLGVNGNATLHGNVSIKQGDRQIHADEIEYNSKTNGFKTDTGIEYEDPLVRITGNGGSYSPAEGASFRSATFDLQQRAARGSAQSLKLTPQGVIDLQGVRFTTCPSAEEAWQVIAKSVTLNTQTQIGEARSARVNFEGVPILYLPWLSFPLSNERKSGFLYPTIGNNSRSGASLSVPYYWNIAPNADFTFEPIIYSRRGADLGGDLRYLNSFDRGELTWNYLPYDNVFNSTRSRVKLVNVMELPGDFRFSINAENLSDTSYFEDFAQGPEGTSTAFVQQQAKVSYRDEHWKLDAELQHYRTLDTTLLYPCLGTNCDPSTPDVTPLNKPYARVPRIAVDADFGLGPAQQLRYGFESEIVNFNRSIPRTFGGAPCPYNLDVPSSPADLCATGWRIDVMPGASLNFDSPGYFIRPGIAWRLTQYQLDNTEPGDSRSPLRTLPIASFDTGLLFEREAGSRNQRRVTLEPRLLYLYVPYRYQDQLPLFDTALPDLDPVELFRTNRYVGADRVGDANQVSLGVTSRLLDAHDGKQFLSATFGQIYYFTNPRVLLPDEIPRTDHRSDFVAQVALTAFQDWSANLGLQWDPQRSQSQRSEVNIQYKPSGQSVVNVGYRYQRDVLEQAEVSSAWPVSDQWNIFVRGIYSIMDHKALERFAGFEYRACCWKVRAGGRSFVTNRRGGEDTGVYLQLELTGLASVGSESDSFLTTAIRGYVPTASATQRAKAP